MNDRMKRGLTVMAVGAICAMPLRVHAQNPRGADTLSPNAVSESLSVLKRLDSRVRTEPSDAAAWYRRGMVAWVLATRAHFKPSIKGLDPTRLGRIADTSLRIAKELQPDSARYYVAAGRYLLSSGIGITRLASRWMYGGAINAARKRIDPDEHAEAAIEMGRVYWRRYDSRANRRLELDPGATPRSMAEAVAPLLRAADALMANTGDGPGSDAFQRGDAGARVEGQKLGDMVGYNPARSDIADGVPQLSFKDAIETFNRLTMPLTPEVQGEWDYINAEAHFREAYEAAPLHEGSLRNLVMLLAEKNRWNEIVSIGRAHTRNAPWDALGWMALGLGAQRTRDHITAAVAFDSGMRLLAPADRKRLDNLERILPSRDSAKFATQSVSERTAWQKLYWLTSDPLWSQQNGSPRLEFLARIAYAEFRWSVDEMYLHGAESDRGNVHIRYGPPEKTFTIGADPGRGITDVTTVWIYKSGLMFVFVGPPAWATARFAFSDREMVSMLMEAQPVRWDNISDIRVDSMPVQAARFRAGTDSVDVIYAARAPVADIQKAADVAGQVTAHLWWVNAANSATHHDSVAANTNTPNVFRQRVATGEYLLRAEASTPGSLRAGHATTAIIARADSATGFTMSGFGISDILLASRVSNLGARRWTDLGAIPVAGTHPRDVPLELVWESYALAQKDAQAAYSASITIERAAGGRVVADIFDRIAAAAGVDRHDDKVIISFDRTVPHADIIPDHIAVSLAGTPPGVYKVTLTLKDIVSGKTTSRTTRIAIGE